MRTALLSLSLFSLCLVSAPVLAQQSPLEVQDQSVVRFEINMDKIVNSELGERLGLKDRLQNIPGLNPEEMDPSAISRVYGALSLPDNIQAFETMGPGGELPMQMFARTEFSNSEALDAAMKSTSDKSEEVTIGGKKFLKSTDPTAPEGALMQKVDDKTMEMGTELYLTRSDREVMSKGLATAWKMAPEHAVRIVVDVAGMEKLKDEIVDELSGQQPQFAAYAELLDFITNLRITIDLDGDELLTICATGKDEEMAEEFADGINSILALGKMTLNPNNAPNEEAKSVMTTISKAMEAKLEGLEISVRIPRPEGFGKMIEGFIPPAGF